MMGLYLEEIEIGCVADLGSHHFSTDGIIAFARKYDPQPFHLDVLQQSKAHSVSSRRRAGTRRQAG